MENWAREFLECANTLTCKISAAMNPEIKKIQIYEQIIIQRKSIFAINARLGRRRVAKAFNDADLIGSIIIVVLAGPYSPKVLESINYIHKFWYIAANSWR